MYSESGISTNMTCCAALHDWW